MLAGGIIALVGLTLWNYNRSLDTVLQTLAVFALPPMIAGRLFLIAGKRWIDDCVRTSDRNSLKAMTRTTDKVVFGVGAILLLLSAL